MTEDDLNEIEEIRAYSYSNDAIRNLINRMMVEYSPGSGLNASGRTGAEYTSAIPIITAVSSAQANGTVSLPGRLQLETTDNLHKSFRPGLTTLYNSSPIRMDNSVLAGIHVESDFPMNVAHIHEAVSGCQDDDDDLDQELL